ncbi:MAG: NADP-dependent oxidoreductase [Nocardiopsaceae bacterium]|nr:NADP-dependent oxidoreductase [Nocardiopsaceae bacterium]
MGNATSSSKAARRVVLAAHPSGLPTAECFAVDTEPVPVPRDGELLLRVRELTVEPFVRRLINPGGDVGIGDCPPATAIAEVVGSADPDHPAGTPVLAATGWREWAAVPADTVRRLDLPAGVPDTAALTALGTSGLTAYAAHARHLAPAAGETVVISSATGAVGSVAGHLAREAGARTVALVGDTAKAEAAREVLGYSAAVVRTSPQWRAELAGACPDGIDAYLHMGGAPLLDAVLDLASVGARISLCGLMDRYNGGPDTWLPASVLIGRRITVRGMVVQDHLDLVGEHRAAVLPMLESGELRLWHEYHQGIESLPAAFSRVMSGRNRGKAVVQM